MKNRILLIISALFICFTAFSQYPPPAGQEGSTAIHKDSLLFVNWATHCVVVRGPMNISNPAAGNASAGEPGFATGKADNQIISLGDGGMATLTFENPVKNGPGPDFAVFENGFLDNFLELAFVEVSSNGVDFFRLNAVSLTETTTQVSTFGPLDATKLHNLAGKYRVEYGTPFDLDELPDDPYLDKNHITHVRVIDVVGSIQDGFATYDSQGNKVNDPWPTAFESGGFDLDAVGVIHEGTQSMKERVDFTVVSIYPNPVSDVLYIKNEGADAEIKVLVCDFSGKKVLAEEMIAVCGETIELNFYSLKSGIYIGRLFSDEGCFSFKIIRN